MPPTTRQNRLMQHKSAIVIGAGIAGLAMARSLSESGYAVSVFEKNARAVGASIRNFGMIWPIGQPAGNLYERALRSKSIWKKVCNEAGLWYEESGSLHLAYTGLEQTVMQEFAEASRNTRPVALLTAAEAVNKSAAVNEVNLKAALWSMDEMIIEPRVAMQQLPAYLSGKYGVVFHFSTAVSSIEYPYVTSGKQRWSADEIFVCSGADFEWLYPDIFAANHFTKCKLQMMRIMAQPDHWRIGPSLCGGLSLAHYRAFEVSPSLPQLRLHYRQTMPDFIKWGIHVMVCQNEAGELTIGDSHEYAMVHEPFDKQCINDLILGYLKQFLRVKNGRVTQSWSGIYPKMTNGGTDFVFSAEAGVTIVNGLGGAGMTLAFGLAEEVVHGYRSNGVP